MPSQQGDVETPFACSPHPPFRTFMQPTLYSYEFSMGDTLLHSCSVFNVVQDLKATSS